MAEPSSQTDNTEWAVAQQTRAYIKSYVVCAVARSHSGRLYTRWIEHYGYFYTLSQF